jgi:hypothetical protein
MRYRKLRIAWSVCWGVAALLALVMWRASYWRPYQISKNYNDNPQFRARFQIVGLIFDSQLGHASIYLLTGNDYLLRIPKFSFLGMLLTHPQQFVIYAQVQYWLLALFTLVPAGAPWLRWSKRFTLRALLIATALVAIVLGLIVAVV